MIPYQSILNTDQTGSIPYIDSAASNGEATFTISGHPGEQLTTATLAAKVDIYKKGVSTGSATDLQIFLIAADGTTYTLYSGTTRGHAQGVGFSVNNSITIPAIPFELLDQTYTIEVVNNVPGEQVYLYNDVDANDFNFQVTLNSATSGFTTGNYLDQNANGVPGEQPPTEPNDDYSVPTGRNSLPIIVPGPHVSSTNVFVAPNASTIKQSVPLIDTAKNSGQSGFTITGYPDDLISAKITATATVYQKGPVPVNSPNDLEVFLIAADGTQYLLYNTSTASASTFSINTTVTIPTSPTAEALDQTFTIKLVDNVADEKATLSGGTTGSLPFTVELGGSANVVNNGTVNSYDVTFDREMRVSTFTPAQVLSIVGPTGQINSPQTFPSTGTSKTFAYNGSYQFIPKAGTLTSTILIANTGLTVSNLTVQLDITDPNDQSLQLILVAPDGTMVPLVNAGAATGANFTNTTFSDAPAVNGQTSTIAAGGALLADLSAREPARRAVGQAPRRHLEAVDQRHHGRRPPGPAECLVAQRHAPGPQGDGHHAQLDAGRLVLPRQQLHDRPPRRPAQHQFHPGFRPPGLPGGAQRDDRPADPQRGRHRRQLHQHHPRRQWHDPDRLGRRAVQPDLSAGQPARRAGRAVDRGDLDAPDH